MIQSWKYDGKKGRRWNVDPKAGELSEWSPYVAFADNPIYYIDPDGQKFLNFDAAGNYTGTTNDNWLHNFFVGSKGRRTLANGGTEKFKFADPKNDVADIQNGRITKLIVVKESQIKSMLLSSGAFVKNNRDNPATFLSKEGVGGGAFDFSFSGIPNEFGIQKPVQDAQGNYRAPNIFLADGVAHNHMNFGNFMFGAGGAALGVHLGALKLGAHRNSMFPEDGQGNRMGSNNLNGYDPQWDSSDDQFSIGEGFSYARGGGLLKRAFGARSWDKYELKGSVQAGPNTPATTP